MKQQSNINSSGDLERVGKVPLRDQTRDYWIDSTEVVQEDKRKTVRDLVSVIMPVYNTEVKLLEAAIQSVQRQTYQNLELIIIDDGSEWKCARQCDEYADDRTKVLHIQNSGVSIARNKGIDESAGKYIAFIDSDDTMDENAISVMVRHIEGVDFVVCGCRHVQDLDNPLTAVMQESEILNQSGCIEDLCYMNPKYNHIETNAIWGKLYRRDLIGNLRLDVDMILAEDFKFNFDYIMKSRRGKYLDFKAYNYLERGDSISRSFKPQMMNTIEKLELMIVENENTSIYDPLISRCVNIAFTILMMLPKDAKEYRKRIERFINIYRSKVLANRETKRKVKIAVATSYVGYGITRKIFDLNRR